MADEFVTRSGYTLQLVAIPYTNVFKIRLRLAHEFEERNEPLLPPTYTIKLWTGDTVELTHDIKTVKTDEERRLWGLHQDACNRLEQAQANATGEYLMARGIIVDPVEQQRWVGQQAEFGFDVSDDPAQQRVEFLSDILTDTRDMNEVTFIIMRLSVKGRIPEEAIAAAEAMFRGSD